MILLVIIFIISLPQLSETVYAVSLPKIAASFGATKILVEYSLTTYFSGFAFGILFWGTISDKIGRKLGLILGLFVYIIGTSLCAVGNTIEYLIIMRFIQGFGASVGSVAGQALVRDVFAQKNRGEVFDKINISIAFVPAIGLSISNVILQYLQWKWVFALLIIVGVIIIINSIIFIPNTKKIEKEKKGLFMDCLKQVLSDYKGLKLTLFVGCSLAVLFGYFAESAFYFKNMLKLTPTKYGAISILISIPLFIGGVISKRMKYSPDKKIYIGIFIMLVSSIVFYLLVVFNIISVNEGNILRTLVLSIICMYSVLMSVSIIIPNCLSQVLTHYGRYVGTAASIFGFLYYLITSLSITLMNLIHLDDMQRLPLFFLFSSFIMIAVYNIGKARVSEKVGADEGI